MTTHSTQNPTDIIIIGAGIAGLAAGCYAQLNGYKTEIFELHDQPGGLCTAWNRQGYVFDGCIHYLFGSGEGQPFNQLWKELGISPKQKFVHHSELMHVKGPEGKVLIVHSDPDRLEEHLISHSLQDRKLIQAFCRDVRAFETFDLSLLQRQPKALMGPLEWARLGMKVLPFVRPMAQWGRLSAQDFSNRFKNAFLRQAITQMFGWSGIPLVAGMSLLSYMHRHNAGFPLGGSLAFARSLEQQYLSFGGQIHYQAQVERILIDDDRPREELHHRARGIQLYNRQTHLAHRVISACDGHNTLYSLLSGKYLTRCSQHMYDGRLPVHSQLQVSLGVNRDLSKDPHWVTYLLEQPVVIAGEARTEIGVKHYCFDESLAPKGKSVVTIMLTTDYDYWQRIYGRPLYHTEEKEEADILINQLERIYPGIKADIEYIDVATPLSYERYTGNWKGSSCGWLLTKKTMPLMIAGLPKTLPGLSHFYQIGQWVEPGGSVPIVAMSGRNIIQQICHEDRRTFSL